MRPGRRTAGRGDWGRGCRDAGSCGLLRATRGQRVQAERVPATRRDSQGERSSSVARRSERLERVPERSSEIDQSRWPPASAGSGLCLRASQGRLTLAGGAEARRAAFEERLSPLLGLGGAVVELERGEAELRD